jgi:conjugal transfer/entry exclusion protein
MRQVINGFSGLIKHIKMYLLIRNTPKITVNITHKIESSMSACQSLYGNESYITFAAT